jgi:hypothetical protein
MSLLFLQKEKTATVDYVAMEEGRSRGWYFERQETGADVAWALRVRQADHQGGVPGAGNSLVCGYGTA